MSVRERLDEPRRRAQIVEAALAVVAQVGYERATMTRIAAHAGIAKGLLWHYFAGKDDLMAHAVRSTVAALREQIAAEIDLDEPVPLVVGSALRRAAALHETHGVELRALQRIVHNLRRADGTPELTLVDYEETYQLQETLFRRGQREGSVRPDLDTRVLAVTYQGAVDTMLSYLDAHPEVDPARYAESLADLLVAAMRRAPGRASAT